MSKKTSIRKTRKSEKPKEFVLDQKADNNQKGLTDPTPDRMDFGGLPERDLKKNLGCG